MTGEIAAGRRIPYAVVVFLVTFLWMSLFSGSRVLLRDCDTGLQVRIGERILSERAVPRTAIFSELEGVKPWTAHSWMGLVVMAIVHKVGGITGVVLFFSFLIASLYAFLAYWGSERDAHPMIFASIIFLSLAVGNTHWLARPHMFSLVLLAVFHRIMVVYDRRESKAIYALPFLCVAWANLHVGFIVGMVLVGTYAVSYFYRFYLMRSEEPEKRKFLVVSGVLVACALCSLLNPYGTGLYSFAGGVVSDPDFANTIVEYLSPDFHDWFFRPFLYMLLFSTALFLASAEKPEIHEILIVCGFTYMALMSNRYIQFYGVVMTPVLFRHASAVLPSGGSGKIPGNPRVWLAAAGVSVAVVAALAFSGVVRHGWDRTKVPLSAAEFAVSEGIPGRMLNLEQFAAVLAYVAPGKFKPFMDGRSDVYAGERWRDHLAIMRLSDGWQDLVDRKYRFNWVFYYNATALSDALVKVPQEWTLVYSDRVANIFVRNSPENAQFLAGHPAVPRVEVPRKKAGG